MPPSSFDDWIATRYRKLWPELFSPEVLDPAVDFLVDLSHGGSALEFGVGTGRVAVPLNQRGIRVHGIELSEAMVSHLPQNGDQSFTVTIGDFATTALNERFDLVYLLRNTITNLTTQDAQVQSFVNAAAHLKPGGCFVVENYIPALQRLPPGETTRVFAATPEHLGYEEYDLAAQLAVSHHTWLIDGEITRFSTPHRYLWPSELDLMARIAGMSLRERYSDWHRVAFTAESTAHVSVWELAA